ncbi:hypothetical protein PUNSTDRAFT_99477 [Punctularia strigosozonata HHB-11173 SS5]|uniref:uncharacterized protein n=1 Tax=Punctularia strigosozonata (strain HHB-11173) TaxID=741275 RepID=UPI0004417002|nr:uncharacterized protein PUNSTDRAFT_99477 [Punctularia strigosozonata HHB-11173 SS5]EIN12075.1 hypothetical protein PUNSTDRAFT_99477 [Punctularia strigosozonata HHB-11173 SS5]
MSSSPSEDSESDSAQEDDDPNPLPDSSVPLGLFANLALGNKKGKDEPSDDSADATGIASASYFRPGPAYDLSARKELIESTTLPAIVAQGFVTPADVVSLFEVYYEWLNPWIPILDPVLYTPVATFKRSPLLFTVVCAIASRYHPSKQHIYPLAMDLAKNEAAAVLVNGLKSVEVAQAFLILAVWPTPYRRWEENRSWIYARLATTMAVEFGLHQIKFRGPKNEIRDRETIMGIRVFILLVETEWGMAARWGKPFSTKRPNDYVDLTTFYKISEYNSPSDVGICAYDCLLQVLMEWSEESRDIAGSNTGVQQSCLEIIEQKVRRFDAKLTDLHDEWITRMEEQIKSCPEVYLASAKFRRDLWPYAVTYSRLLVCSFWFRAALKRGLTADNAELFNKCLESATNVVTMSTQTLIPSKFMKYAPDAWFDQAAFASAFLLKLAALQPKLPGLFSDSQKASSIQLVRKFIAGYRASAVDEQHAPSLYARFLDNIITRRFSSSEPQDYLNSKDGHSSRSPSAAPSTASSEGSQAFYTSVFSVVPPSGNRTSAPQPEPTPMYGGSLFDLDNWNFDPIPSFNGGDRAYGFNPNIPGNQTPF